MTKRISKADRLVFKALQKAIAEDKIHICLINSKINIPGSPIYNPWEILLPTLAPLLLGLLLIWWVGILWGLVFMIAGILLSSNLVKKEIEHRLLERAKNFLIADFEACNQIWDFGGIVLVKTDDKQKGCIAPENSWKEFVILNFADLMTDKPKEQLSEEKVDEEAA